MVQTNNLALSLKHAIEEQVDPRVKLSTIFKFMKAANAAGIDLGSVAEQLRLREIVPNLLFESELHESRSAGDELTGRFLRESRLSLFSQSLPKSLGSVVIVGSGPLPLSAIGALNRFHRAHVKLIDASDVALAASMSFLHRLGFAGKPVQFVQTVGENYEFQDEDLVVIRSAVTNKKAIFDQVTRRVNSRILVQFDVPIGNFAYLYPGVDIIGVMPSDCSRTIHSFKVSTNWFEKTTWLVEFFAG